MKLDAFRTKLIPGWTLKPRDSLFRLLIAIRSPLESQQLCMIEFTLSGARNSMSVVNNWSPLTEAIASQNRVAGKVSRSSEEKRPGERFLRAGHPSGPG